jgi:hypothetical protein
MAITRAQQFRQMLEDGGMLVSPSTTGKRPGYRGDAAAKAAEAREKETGQKSSRAATTSRSDPGERDTPGFNPVTNRFEKPDGTPEVARTPEEVQQSLDAAIAQGKFKKKNPIEKFLDDYTKGTRKTLYNIFPNKADNELAYLKSLPFSQRALLSPALRAKLEALELDEDQDLLDTANTKFTFDEFEELRKFQPTDGSLNFAEYAAKFRGAPGLLYSGDVGDLVTIKNPDGTYRYERRRDDGPGGQILFPENMPGDPSDPGDGDDGGDDQNTQTGSGLSIRFRKDGGRIGADKGGIMKASYGYDDAMAETFEEFLRLKKIKEIPADMEFDEYLDQLDIDVPYSKKDKGEQRATAQEGGMMDSPVGGIMDLESARQMYGLGKLVKKATRAIKKITKSPLGKAAILGGALYFGGGGGLPKLLGGKGLGGFSAKTFFSKANPLLFSNNELSLGKLAALSAVSPFLFQEDEEEDQTLDRGPSLDIARIRNNPYDFLGRAFVADGGIMRLGYQEGSKEPVAKKTMPLLDLDGQEMDLRDNGGFVPIGRMEKADDVPARLSKNEFVFTAEAVRNAGEGDVDKGAEVMYNMMKNLEAGGEVSEESQGLEGAREMFQTSKRLEEVL